MVPVMMTSFRAGRERRTSRRSSNSRKTKRTDKGRKGGNSLTQNQTRRSRRKKLL